ncbi:MAG: dTDP-4-dehydrorhamnose reductase [Candidatus Doudnabacteria bacterium]
MKILILGAKGSLGEAFLDLYKDQEVVGWGKFDLDITDEEVVSKKIAELKPGLVINCAAYNAVDKAEEERELAESVNGYAPGYLAKAASEVGAVFVHFSTHYVFDGTNQEGYNEDDLPNARSIYGKSKILGENEVQGKTDKFYIIRTAWLYGKPGSHGKTSFVAMMLKKADEGKAIEAIKDEFAQPTYCLDLAQSTRALLEEKKPFGIYHLTNAGQTSWYQWANEIFQIKNVKVTLTAISRDKFPRKAARPQYGVLNNNKFIQLRPWTEALKEYLG